MNNKNLKELWKKEEEKVFQGWDFSYITERSEEEIFPWNYKNIINEYLKDSDILLDMGTGGGEYLLNLNHPYNNTYVTEGYLPNYELCLRKLMPLGITVKQVINDNELPFEDNFFDLVINRHESFDLNEVYRILKPNGIFITQQVGGLNNIELARFLINDNLKSKYPDLNLNNSVNLANNIGFHIIDKNEYYPYLRFYDIGALVYFAKIIEWEFPGFTVNKCFDKLCELHKTIEEKGYVESKEHRFMLILKK